MYTFYHTNDKIDVSDLLPRMIGEYSKKCLEKIVRMDNRLVAVHFNNGQFSERGETLYMSEMLSSGREVFHVLCTDDSCLSHCAMGPRFDPIGGDRILEAINRNESRPGLPEPQTNLVMTL